MTNVPAPQPTLMPDLASVATVAQELGIHSETLKRLCRAGQFPPAVRVGKKWLVSRPRLERYLHGEAPDAA